MIDAPELAELQADIAAIACDKTCVISRLSSFTPNSRGVPDETSYSTIATVSAGMRQPTGTHLQNYAYAIEALASWLVHFPVGTDVRKLDHLIIDGQTLEVQIILTPQSYPALLSVLASELK
jgi:hypothetical protein